MKKKQRTPWLSRLLWMAIISFLILTIVFLLIKIYARQGQEFVLPDLVGMNVMEIEHVDSLDIKLVVMDSIFEKGDAGGRILNQDPKPGTRIKHGRKVYITMTAFSPENAVMPELTDMSLRQAVSQLENSGLTCGKLRFVESPYRNAVLEHSCKGRIVYAGQSLERGSLVDLVVGRGEGEAYTIVPFVIGKNADKARHDLLVASLNVGREHFAGVKNRRTAVVYQQDPDYTGVSRYEYGTSVELWYKDVEQCNVDQMVRDFQVDSSKIINPAPSEDEEEFESVAPSW